MNKSRLSRWLVLVAALLYSSWPIGYVLNPEISRRGVASELGAYGQPYNWLFISADIIAGLLAFLAAITLWLRLTQERKQRWVRGTIFNLGLFGLFTAIDAALPLGCTPSVQTCPSIQNDPLLLLHGIASVSAIVCLGMCAVILMRKNKNPRRIVATAIVILASLLLGILSVVFFFLTGPGAFIQHILITICSLWLAFIPAVLYRVIRATKKARDH